MFKSTDLMYRNTKMRFGYELVPVRVCISVILAQNEVLAVLGIAQNLLNRDFIFNCKI